MVEARSNKGISFTLEERQLLRIHGLLPPRVMTMEETVDAALRNLRGKSMVCNNVTLQAVIVANETLSYQASN